jgi:hypothetical protein
VSAIAPNSGISEPCTLTLVSWIEVKIRGTLVTLANLARMTTMRRLGLRRWHVGRYKRGLKGAQAWMRVYCDDGMRYGWSCPCMAPDFRT